MQAIMVIGLAVAFDAAAQQRSLPSYIVLEHFAPEVTLSVSDSTFYERSAGIVFPVNSWEMPSDTAWLEELHSYWLPLLQADGWALSRVELRGAASPEGPYEWNETLSHNRLNTLIKFIGLEPDEASVTAEDYDGLVHRMRRAGDRDYARVAEIVDQNDDARRIKKRLQSDAELWQRILYVYFPELRTARMMLYFTKLLERFYSHVGLSLPAPPFTVKTAVYEPFKSLYQHITNPPMIALSTNLAAYGLCLDRFGWAPMPNISVEYFPRGSDWSVMGTFTFPYYHRWAQNEFFQIRDYTLAARRYFPRQGELYTGWYAGAYAQVNKYGIGLGPDKGWQGEGWGVGLAAGWATRLGDSGWRIDLGLQSGFYQTKFDPYVYGNPVTGDIDGDYYYDYIGPANQFHKRRHRLTWLGPTMLRIAISYDLLYHRSPSGATFRRKEVTP